MMHTQASWDLEMRDSQIHALESSVKVQEVKESNLKLKLQRLLIFGKDDSKKELLENEMANCWTLMVNELNKLSDAWFDRMVEFKNEQWYAKRFWDFEKVFKALENKLSNFEMNFDKACKSIFLSENKIVNINDQVQKMNNSGGPIFLSFTIVL